MQAAGPVKPEVALGLHHAAHAAAAVHIAPWRASRRGRFGFGKFGDERLRGQQQAGNAGTVFQRRARNLGRIYDSGLDEILVFFG